MPDDLSVVSSQPAAPSGDLTVAASQPAPKPGLLSSMAAAVTGAPEVQAPLQGIEGVGEAAIDTVQGLKTGVNKLTGLNLPDVPGRTGDPNAPPDTPAMKVGKVVEEAGEWVAGEGILAKAGDLLKVTQRFPQLIALMNNSPKAYETLIKALEAGTLGAGQAALKAPSEGKDPAKAAEYGAAGGALMAGGTEALFGGARAIMNKAFGATPQEAFAMAARPYAADVNWERAAQRGIPRVEQAARNQPFKDFGGFVDLLDDTKGQVWDNEVQPVIDKNKNEVLNGNPIAAAIRAKKTTAMAALPSVFQPELNEIESIARDFDNFNVTLGQSNDILKALNVKLAGFYNMSPAERAAARITDGQLAGLEAAADGLRDGIYAKLSQTMTPAEATKFFEARQDYGALKDLHRIFARRQVVVQRQAPINLPQALGGIEATAALLMGHPVAALAGAVPIASRWANSAEQLTRRGLALQRGSGAFRRGVEAAAPMAAGFLGAEAGRAAVPVDEDLTPEPVAQQ